jgi:DNA-binding NarL/FixJ family response regulator
MAMKFLLVDDHHLIREALQGVLKELRHDSVVLEASNGVQAMQTVAEQPTINLVLLDLTLPDRDGFTLLEELRERYPAIAVVVLSALQDRAYVLRALDLGASGYIPKSASREVMSSAIQLVLAGGIYIPPQILERGASPEGTAAQPARKEIGLWCSELGLTERQIDVLALMMQGMSNKTICRTLSLAEPTVKNHVTSILQALNVKNRTEAVIAVNKLGTRSMTRVKS